MKIIRQLQQSCQTKVGRLLITRISEFVSVYNYASADSSTIYADSSTNCADSTTNYADKRICNNILKRKSVIITNPCSYLFERIKRPKTSQKKIRYYNESL